MMKVLVACEFSGVVRDAFTAKGHHAVSCDLLPSERPGEHIQGNVLEILADGWDLMIAHPPCTYLSNAGNRYLDDERKVQRNAAAIFFLYLWEAPIERICVENPVGHMSSFLRKPNQIINPYYFGDPPRKRTCLWLKNLQPLVHRKEDDLFGKRTHTEPELFVYYGNNKGKRRRCGEWYYRANCMGKKKAAHERSRTFPGIALSMAEQWG